MGQFTSAKNVFAAVCFLVVVAEVKGRVTRDTTGHYHGEHHHEHVVATSAEDRGPVFPPNCLCVVKGSGCIGREEYTSRFIGISTLACGHTYERCCFEDPWPGLVDDYAAVAPCVPQEECTRWYGQAATDVSDYGVLGPCPGLGTVRCVEGAVAAAAPVVVPPSVQYEVPVAPRPPSGQYEVPLPPLPPTELPTLPPPPPPHPTELPTLPPPPPPTELPTLPPPPRPTTTPLPPIYDLPSPPVTYGPPIVPPPPPTEAPTLPPPPPPTTTPLPPLYDLPSPPITYGPPIVPPPVTYSAPQPVAPVPPPVSYAPPQPVASVPPPTTYTALDPNEAALEQAPPEQPFAPVGPSPPYSRPGPPYLWQRLNSFNPYYSGYGWPGYGFRLRSHLGLGYGLFG